MMRYVRAHFSRNARCAYGICARVCDTCVAVNAHPVRRVEGPRGRVRGACELRNSRALRARTLCILRCVRTMLFAIRVIGALCSCIVRDAF